MGDRCDRDHDRNTNVSGAHTSTSQISWLSRIRLPGACDLPSDKRLPVTGAAVHERQRDQGDLTNCARGAAGLGGCVHHAAPSSCAVTVFSIIVVHLPVTEINGVLVFGVHSIYLFEREDTVRSAVTISSPAGHTCGHCAPKAHVRKQIFPLLKLILMKTEEQVKLSTRSYSPARTARQLPSEESAHTQCTAL